MAVSIDDMVKALQTMKEWRQLVTLPARVRALEEQVASLTGKPQGPAPLKTCPFCRVGALRLDRIEPDPTFGDLGVKRGFFVCDDCSRTVDEEMPK
jgi:hypothetical protein